VVIDLGDAGSRNGFRIEMPPFPGQDHGSNRSKGIRLFGTT